MKYYTATNHFKAHESCNRKRFEFSKRVHFYHHQEYQWRYHKQFVLKFLDDLIEQQNP